MSADMDKFKDGMKSAMKKVAEAAYRQGQEDMRERAGDKAVAHGAIVTHAMRSLTILPFSPRE